MNNYKKNIKITRINCKKMSTLADSNHPVKRDDPAIQITPVQVL
jgi:hypothetical protein